MNGICQTTDATSSGLPNRLRGIKGRTRSLGRPSVIDVSIKPGATTLMYFHNKNRPSSESHHRLALHLCD